KEIQESIPRTSYRQALSQARRQRGQEVVDLDVRIARLEAALRDNAQANKAAQRVATLDAELETLRANRAAVGVPATAERQTVSDVRAALSDLGLNQPAPSAIDAGRPADAS